MYASLKLINTILTNRIIVLAEVYLFNREFYQSHRYG